MLRPRRRGGARTFRTLLPSPHTLLCIALVLLIGTPPHSRLLPSQQASPPHAPATSSFFLAWAAPTSAPTPGAPCVPLGGDPLRQDCTGRGIRSTDDPRIPNLVRALHLQDNPLRVVPAGAFTRFAATLRLLDLQLCEITKIDVNAFSDLPLLTNLRLDANPLGNGLPPFLFHGTPALKSLYLQATDITTLEANTFAGLSRLELLEFPTTLSRPETGIVLLASAVSRLRDPIADIFAPFRESLKELSIGGQGLLAAELFGQPNPTDRLFLPALEHLLCPFCSLRAWPSGPNMPSVTQMDLGFNDFAELSYQNTMWTPALTQLELSRECELRRVGRGTWDASVVPKLKVVQVIRPCTAGTASACDTATGSRLTCTCAIGLGGDNMFCDTLCPALVPDAAAPALVANCSAHRLDQDVCLVPASACASPPCPALLCDQGRWRRLPLATTAAPCSFDPATRHLDCSGSALGGGALTSVPATTPGSALAGARILDCRRNRISHLSPHLLALAMPNLTALHLDMNPLTSTAPRAFAGLSRLKTLTLSGTQIDPFPFTFFGLDNLETLVLSNISTLTTLRPGVFASLPLLNQLDLRRSALQSISSRSFSGLANLAALRLSHIPTNPPPHVTPSVLPSLASLELDMAVLLTDELRLGADNLLLSPFPAHLQQLTLVGPSPAPLLSANTVYRGLQPHLLPRQLAELTNLTTLRLEAMELTSLSPWLFHRLPPSLVSLHIDSVDNVLHSVDSGWFLAAQHFLPHLSTLNITGASSCSFNRSVSVLPICSCAPNYVHASADDPLSCIPSCGPFNPAAIIPSPENTPAPSTTNATTPANVTDIFSTRHNVTCIYTTTHPINLTRTDNVVPPTRAGVDGVYCYTRPSVEAAWAAVCDEHVWRQVPLACTPPELLDELPAARACKCASPRMHSVSCAYPELSDVPAGIPAGVVVFELQSAVGSSSVTGTPLTQLRRVRRRAFWHLPLLDGLKIRRSPLDSIEVDLAPHSTRLSDLDISRSTVARLVLGGYAMPFMDAVSPGTLSLQRALFHTNHYSELPMYSFGTLPMLSALAPLGGSPSAPMLEAMQCSPLLPFPELSDLRLSNTEGFGIGPNAVLHFLPPFLSDPACCPAMQVLDIGGVHDEVWDAGTFAAMPNVTDFKALELPQLLAVGEGAFAHFSTLLAFDSSSLGGITCNVFPPGSGNVLCACAGTQFRDAYDALSRSCIARCLPTASVGLASINCSSAPGGEGAGGTRDAGDRRGLLRMGAVCEGACMSEQAMERVVLRCDISGEWQQLSSAPCNVHRCSRRLAVPGSLNSTCSLTSPSCVVRCAAGAGGASPPQEASFTCVGDAWIGTLVCPGGPAPPPTPAPTTAPGGGGDDGGASAASSSSSSGAALVPIAAGVAAVLLLLIVVAVVVVRQRRRSAHSSRQVIKSQLETVRQLEQRARRLLSRQYGAALGLSRSCDGKDALKHLDVPPACLEQVERIGQGAFGVVWRGVMSGASGAANSGTAQRRAWGNVGDGERRMEVALKTLRATAAPEDHFKLILEGLLMSALVHPHIMPLLGICLQSPQPQLVMPFQAGGDLRSLLRSERGRRLDMAARIDVARQIAEALAFLATKNVVHRDVAARNCFVASASGPPPPLQAVLGDFGLSRDVDGEAGAMYLQVSNDSLPIRWMALESIEQRVYTHQSDAWAFGVLLWEVASGGATPYPDWPLQKLVHELRSGYRLARPEHCPPALHVAMRQCWQLRPEDRPEMAEMAAALAVWLQGGLGGDLLLGGRSAGGDGRDGNVRGRVGSRGDSLHRMQSVDGQLRRAEGGEGLGAGEGYGAAPPIQVIPMLLRGVAGEGAGAREERPHHPFLILEGSGGGGRAGGYEEGMEQEGEDGEEDVDDDCEVSL